MREATVWPTAFCIQVAVSRPFRVYKRQRGPLPALSPSKFMERKATVDKVFRSENSIADIFYLSRGGGLTGQ